MKPQPTSEQIAKLPKWAQDHIRNCERQRDEANRIVTQTLDSQTPTPFYIEDIRGTEPSNGERFIRRYFDAHGMTVEHNDIKVDITLRGDNIELSWGDKFRADVNMQPIHFQAVRLSKTK